MGYRNRLPGKVTAIDGERATISIGGSLIAGIARVPLAIGQDVVLAARPDDVATGPASPSALQAKVETIEYRGRDFVGTANMSDGHNLVFHASAHAEPGSTVSLTVDPNRALIFPA
ncbi:ABC transporter ATP-binding protein [Brucella vulpis]|nr:ABC transporter ATP-binding protein [Brucella vulpis]CUW51354.1 ABC transporter ATP-binding protein [Brucella vulpis]